MLSNATEDRDVSCEVRYLVRCGRNGSLYSMRAGAASLERGDWIVCRTSRGVELGEVLTEVLHTLEAPDQTWETAKWIRGAREEDQFLLKQLETLSQQACEQCQQMLDSKSSEDVLLDVEPLLDGKTLFFHFLGTPSGETERVIDELASAYQTSVSKSRFAELLKNGCGPGCGTPEKSGCGTGGGCAVCAIAGGCTSPKKR
ncbi:hypothetical protein SH501x_002806 [Pirellulaceae bacterium SH501]